MTALLFVLVANAQSQMKRVLMHYMVCRSLQQSSLPIKVISVRPTRYLVHQAKP